MINSVQEEKDSIDTHPQCRGVRDESSTRENNRYSSDFWIQEGWKKKKKNNPSVCKKSFYRVLCREERAVRVDVQSSRGRINEEGWNSLESASRLPLVLNRVGRAQIRNNREASCHYCYLIGDCIVAAGCSQLAKLRVWGGPSPCSALVHMRMTLTAGRNWHLQLLLISSLTTATFLYPALPLFTQTPLLFLFPTFSLLCPFLFHPSI